MRFFVPGFALFAPGYNPAPLTGLFEGRRFLQALQQHSEAAATPSGVDGLVDAASGSIAALNSRLMAATPCGVGMARRESAYRQ